MDVAKNVNSVFISIVSVWSFEPCIKRQRHNSSQIARQF